MIWGDVRAPTYGLTGSQQPLRFFNRDGDVPFFPGRGYCHSSLSRYADMRALTSPRRPGQANNRASGGHARPRRRRWRS